MANNNKVLLQIQVLLDLLVPMERKVKEDRLASLGCKAHQADEETLERQEILEHRVQVVNQDHRVQLVNLETWVPLVRLEIVVQEDSKGRLVNPAHEVVECCITHSHLKIFSQNHSSLFDV